MYGKKLITALAILKRCALGHACSALLFSAGREHYNTVQHSLYYPLTVERATHSVPAVRPPIQLPNRPFVRIE
jgi:hypothetical protein